MVQLILIAVHCEKEREMHSPTIWDPEKPYTHTTARRPEAEVYSVKDQIELAEDAGFKGTLHICHISVPRTLKDIEDIRKRNYAGFRITCGLTPHHALLYDKMMSSEYWGSVRFNPFHGASIPREMFGLALKMNPPLRERWMQQYMINALIKGRINCVETDHAPHTLKDKITGEKDGRIWKGYASGIPGFPFLPHFIKILRERHEMSQETIDNITHNNIVQMFGLPEDLIQNSHREPDMDLFREYELDAFVGLH